MVKIIYNKGSLFKEMNPNFIYVHANNSQGNWGKGIALEFSKRFPLAYENHKALKNIPGMGYILDDGGFKVGCLITSKGYGKYKDNSKEILLNTYFSIIDLLDKTNDDLILIKSPKINSGLFDVPWKFTEKIIAKACAKTNKNIEWHIWEL